MQVSAVTSPSPSFNSYSYCHLTEIAARVVQEFRGEDDKSDKQEKTPTVGFYEAGILSDSGEKHGGEEEEDFEFAYVKQGISESFPPISADDIFHNGIIWPVGPISNPNLLLGSMKYYGSVEESGMNSGLLRGGVNIGTPLRKLFTDQRETSTTSSCSSSEADDLDGVSAETYCMWQSKSSDEGRLKKSSSTGWKFKAFLQKSHSVDSGGGFAIASLDNVRRKRDDCIVESPVSQHGAWKDDFVSRTTSKGMQPLPYKRDDSEKQRYRHHLAGFFANVNKLSKNFHPF